MDRLGQSNELLVLALDVNGPARAVVASCRAYARFGRNDVLVNNAGYGIIAAVEEETAEEVEALFRTNAFGLLAVTHAILPLMRTQSAGRILNFLVIGCLSNHEHTHRRRPDMVSGVWLIVRRVHDEGFHVRPEKGIGPTGPHGSSRPLACP
jgi:hypothetical protein|nr:SDR family NAD(P)-dependent oxidoreductase [Neorhizobium tomejilense]